MHQFILFNFWQ